MGLFDPNVEKMKTRKDIPGLVKVLEHAKEPFWGKAQDALIEIGTPAIPALTAVMQTHRDGNVRMRASYSLAEIQKLVEDTALLAGLAQTWLQCLQDTEASIRQNAVFAINDLAQYCPGLQLPGHGKTLIQVAAPLLLQRLDEPYQPALRNVIFGLRWALSAVSPSERESALDSIITMMLHEELAGDFEDAIVSAGVVAAPALLRALENQDPRTRGKAASIIGDLLENNLQADLAAQAVAPLLKVLADNEPWIQGNALYALSAVAALLEPDAQRKVLPRLTPFFHDAMPLNRQNAVCVAVNMGLPESIPVLLDAANDEFPAAAQIALNGLGQLGALEATGLLIKKLDHSDEEVRAGAVRGLGKIAARHPHAQEVPSILQALPRALGWFETVDQEVGEILAQAGRAGVDALSADIQAREWSASGMLAALQLLTRLKGAGVPTAWECALRKMPQPIFHDAVKLIQQSSDLQLAEALARVLPDGRLDGAMVNWAVECLTAMGWQPRSDAPGVAYCCLRQDWSSLLKMGPSAIPLLSAQATRWMGWDFGQNVVQAAEKIAAASSLPDDLDHRLWLVNIRSIKYRLEPSLWDEIVHFSGQPLSDVQRHVLEDLLVRLCKNQNTPATALIDLLIEFVKVEPDAQRQQAMIAALLEEFIFYEHRSTFQRQHAATCLVAMYHSGSLPETCRALILARRDKITEPHFDGQSVTCGSEHGDLGIGVAF